MRPATARVALVMLAAVMAAAFAVARRGADTVDPDPVADGPAVAADTAALPVLAPSAPRIDVDGWLNSQPLTAQDLTGKVVLYEFWTFGCVNCRNVLPYVRAWHDRYEAEGLIVLSIHTPEFGYEADPAAVARFVAEHDVPFPVALDPERRTWRAFDNHYWPAMYLHDQQGRRRLVRFGEGGYAQTEHAIRSLLGVAPDAPAAEVPS